MAKEEPPLSMPSLFSSSIIIFSYFIASIFLSVTSIAFYLASSSSISASDFTFNWAIAYFLASCSARAFWTRAYCLAASSSSSCFWVLVLATCLENESISESEASSFSRFSNPLLASSEICLASSASFFYARDLAGSSAFSSFLCSWCLWCLWAACFSISAQSSVPERADSLRDTADDCEVRRATTIKLVANYFIFNYKIYLDNIMLEI